MDLVLSKWTDPVDGDKEAFFRNMIGLLIDKDKLATLKVAMILLSIINKEI